MNDIIDFFTDKTGLVAAIVVVLGIITALKSIGGGWLGAAPNIDIRSVEVRNPPASSDVATVHFLLVNTGRRPATLHAMALDVRSAEPSATPAMRMPEAEVPTYNHQVRLDGGIGHVVFRDPAAADGPAVLQLEQGKPQQIRLLVTSAESLVYRFDVVVDSLDTGRRATATRTVSSDHELDFPPSAEELVERLRQQPDDT